ncbi:MAG: hypothetical protein NZ533_06105, partial [Casimicrobiaceae bacterium]|nr:hypothetical protein [Casimicrobiaceae bacterium]
PYRQLTIGHLEALFSRSHTNVEVLKLLEHELRQRNTSRAIALLSKVLTAINDVAGPSSASARELPRRNTEPKQSELWEQIVDKASRAIATPTSARYRARRSKPTVFATESTTEAARRITIEVASNIFAAAVNSSWESIELKRRQLVLKSHPERLKPLPIGQRERLRAEAENVNAAYLILFVSRRRTP